MSQESEVYAYIDGQNLHFGIRSLGWKIDHKKFRQYLSEEHGVTKAYIFLGFMEEHQDLYNVLQEAGFICFFKPLVRYDDGTIKGNVDADMVLQVMVDIDKYDKAIIVSGDGDFTGLLRHLSQVNKLGQIIIPNREKYSSLFDRIEDFDESHVTYMNDLRSQLSYRDRRHRNTRPSHTNGTKNTQRQNTSARPAPKKAPSKTQKSSKPTAPKQARRPRKQQNPKRAQKSDFKPKSALEKSLIETIDTIG